MHESRRSGVCQRRVLAKYPGVHGRGAAEPRLVVIDIGGELCKKETPAWFQPPFRNHRATLQSIQGFAAT